MKSVANFFYCLKCSETSAADHKYAGKKKFKLRSLLRNVLVSRYCKTKV